MADLGFLTARAWLDEDGQHIWLAHDHKGYRDRSMLLYPDWQAVDGKVEPSVVCDCGLHVVGLVIGEPEAAKVVVADEDALEGSD
jgi:hypothetical protein